MNAHVHTERRSAIVGIIPDKESPLAEIHRVMLHIDGVRNAPGWNPSDEENEQLGNGHYSVEQCLLNSPAEDWGDLLIKWTVWDGLMEDSLRDSELLHGQFHQFLLDIINVCAADRLAGRQYDTDGPLTAIMTRAGRVHAIPAPPIAAAEEVVQ